MCTLSVHGWECTDLNAHTPTHFVFLFVSMLMLVSVFVEVLHFIAYIDLNDISLKFPTSETWMLHWFCVSPRADLWPLHRQLWLWVRFLSVHPGHHRVIVEESNRAAKHIQERRPHHRSRWDKNANNHVATYGVLKSGNPLRFMWRKIFCQLSQYDWPESALNFYMKPIHL